MSAKDVDFTTGTDACRCHYMFPLTNQDCREPQFEAESTD
jgi:hypothetical protein